MSDASDTVGGARQLGDSSQWNKTVGALADEYDPNKKAWSRASIERAAKTAWQLIQKRVSTSPYRDNDKPIGDTSDFVQWTNGYAHALYVEEGAKFGDPESLEIVKKAATAGNARAKALLASLGK